MPSGALVSRLSPLLGELCCELAAALRCSWYLLPGATHLKGPLIRSSQPCCPPPLQLPSQRKEPHCVPRASQAPHQLPGSGRQSSAIGFMLLGLLLHFGPSSFPCGPVWRTGTLGLCSGLWSQLTGEVPSLPHSRGLGKVLGRWSRALLGLIGGMCLW